MEPESKTKTLLQLVFSNSILKCLFRRSRRQLYQKCSNNCCKNHTLLEATPKTENFVSSAPARADRGSNPLENHKYQRKRDLRTNTPKGTAKGTPLGYFWDDLEAKTHQARDKTSLRSHDAPDLRKPTVFDGPGT
jgi:hypothetical protein